jgi:hypothetical protein
MKRTYVILALLIPFFSTAQQSEPVRKKVGDQQVFQFPDNIKFNKNELNERVEKKTRQLTDIIKVLAQKKDGDYHKELSAAMKLFNYDNRKTVTVTSKRHPEPVTKPVLQYLTDLAKLHYDKVNIIWHNALYISNFTKQPDGNYTGLVAFEQEFIGINGAEANYNYQDLTQKRIEVTVKVWEGKDPDGMKKEYMDVFLGNIGVTEE